MYIYYVYAYLRPDGSPYYIGKGKGNRYKNQQGRRVRIPKDTSQILFLETNLSDVGACALERRYIRWYGRKDIGTGILRNLTDGGDGTSGTSPEHRAKLAAVNMGKKYTSEHKANISVAKAGKKHTAEQRAKNAAGHIGKKLTSETRAKLSAIRRGKKLGPKTPEQKAKLSAANTGKKLTSEHRANIGAGTRRSVENGTHHTVQKYTCPHCGKIGKGLAMKRHHFDNCKSGHIGPKGQSIIP